MEDENHFFKAIFSWPFAAAILATALVGLALERIGVPAYLQNVLVWCVGFYGGRLAGKAYLASVGK